MEKCPFWSTKNNIFNCNNECPIYDLDDGCKFQVLFNVENIDNISELDELEYVIN